MELNFPIYTPQEMLSILSGLITSQQEFRASLEKFELDLKKSNEAAEKRNADAEKRHADFEADLQKSREKFEADLQKSNEAAEKRNKEFDKKMGSLTGFLGKFTEEMIRPNIIPMFKAKGINVETLLRSVVGKKDGKDYYEIDWLLIDTNIAVIVEVKTKFTKDDVDEHLERLNRISEIAPKHILLNEKTLLGAVAAITYEDGVDRYAYKKGLYVLKQTGNLVSIINEENFKPCEWKTNY